MNPQVVQFAVAFWLGFAVGVAALKFGWPKLAEKIAAARESIKAKL